MNDRMAWARVADLFSDALEQPPETRAQWLDEVCRGDATMRARVETLLDADGRTDGLLETPVALLASAALAEDEAPPGPPRTAPGDHIGPYRLLREAGRGGMGVVYQAYDARLGRFVALKVLAERPGGDGPTTDRALAEARAAAALDHPSICTIYDVGQAADGDRYIAMAYYPGQTLAERLEHGALAVSEAVYIARRILDGLAAAHAHGIVHRDIKPSNVLLTSRYDVKILDFGIATVDRHDPSSAVSSRLGTPRYMAPEQFRGRPADHRADQWAVGVVLYEMLTGRWPFRGRTVAELSRAVLEDPPAAMGGNPAVERLEPAIGRALAKEPAARYPDARAFRAAIDAALPEPQPARPWETALPAPITSFVGRETEVREVTARLEHARLVTLTGPGGAGKTRLAVEVARRVASRYPDGVRFVPLGAVRDGPLVPHQIAQQLGVTDALGAAPEELVSLALEAAELLLVLDNFEHVVSAAPLVGTLLQRCPKLRVLVTSRAALHLEGEQEWAVPPLAPPEPGDAAGAAPEALLRNPAVALFVARAQAIRPAFRLTDANAPAVVELCLALDGLPLAIELAAAQIKLLTPDAIQRRLGRHMDLLKGGRLDAPPRHQTLSEAVAWSYNLLPDDARRLFRRLSAFEAGGALEAVEAVAAVAPNAVADVLGALATLVDHSLVRQMAIDHEPRFEMLQTIRAFAVRRFDDVEEAERHAVRRGHAGYVLALVTEAEPQLTGSEQTLWLDRLERERGNLRAAIEGALATGDHETALRIAAAAWRVWLVRGPLAEGRALLETALEASAGRVESPTRARVLASSGTIAHNQGDNQLARERLQQSLALWRAIGDRRGIASALTDLAWVHCELSDLEPARALSTEALALHREAGEQRGMARALNNLGWIANYQADYGHARAYLEEGLALRRDIGDARGVAFVLASLAWAEEYHGDCDRAERLLAEARPILDRINDPVLMTFSRLMAAQLVERRGDLEPARRTLEALVPFALRSGNGSLLAWTHTALGRVALKLGDREVAARALARACDTWRAIHSAWGLALALVPTAELCAATDRPRAAAAIADAIAIFDRLGDARGLADAWDAEARIVADHDPPRARALAEQAAARRRDAGLPPATSPAP